MAEEAKLSLHLGSDPTLAVLRVGGEELTAAKRRALRQSLDDNDLDEIRFDALVFRDGPNANAFRFRQQDLAFFGSSFAGQPFLRDHDTHSIESRDGTILASRLEQGAFIQEIAITTARGMRAMVEGQIDRFSIGWYFDAVTCSVCNQDLLSSRCSHWPGGKYKVRVGDGAEVEVLCEAIFENPSGKETSAVNAPAVHGTGILAQLQYLKERSMAGAAPAVNPDEEVTTMAEDILEQVDEQPVQPQTQTPDWAAYLQKQAMEAALGASGLPSASREAVRAAVGPHTTPAELDALIDAQRTLIAALQKDQVVTGMNRPMDGGRIGGMSTGLDKITLAAEAMFAGVQPKDGGRPLSGIRELYLLLSGDYEMRGVFNPDNVGLANVNSSTMAGLVANVMNKTVVNTFQTYPRWWEPIVFEEDFANLQTIQWITLGGIGDLPTVAEGAAYTELTWDDQKETASWLKKGGYLGITLEAMDKDDTRRLQMAPRALAQSAYLTLSKAVSTIFTGTSGTGPLMSDGVRLFHTVTHGNLGTSALSYSSWGATRTAMRKQTELNSGERLGGLMAPKYLLVPPDLESTALVTLMSEGQPGGANNDENPWAIGIARDARLASAHQRVIVVDLWTDTNDWAAVADPVLYPSIGIGYRFGRVPSVWSVADKTSGLMFTNDVMPIKVQWFFATGPTDWRGVYKHNVT